MKRIALVAALSAPSIAIAGIIGHIPTENGTVRLTDLPCDKGGAVAYHVGTNGLVTGGCWSVDQEENAFYVVYADGTTFLYQQMIPVAKAGAKKES